MEYKSCFRFLMEMAYPRESDFSATYYHGTSSIESVIGILRDESIKPSVNRSRRTAVPVLGRMYMTRSIYYALIYAMGGIKMGTSPWKGDDTPDRRYGAVFIIPGTELRDIQPDEDAVGEILHDVLKNSATHDYRYDLLKFPQDLNWLKWMAEINLTPLQLKKLINYEDYGHLIVAGKKLVKILNNDQKLMLIDLGASIAHEGGVKPAECWLVDKMDSEKYSKDGSNFFQVARKVGLQEVLDLKKSV